MTTSFKMVFFLALILALGAGCSLICAQEPARPPKEPSAADQDRGLRGVFFGKDNDPVQSHRLVGRLTILLKTGEGTLRVRPDYSFRSGARFRFEITSNRDGWLYVMHAASGGDWQQLWPSQHENNKVQADQSYEVPPRPGIFIFDKDTGNEFFYVVVRSDAKPPTLDQPNSPTRPTEPAEKTSAAAAGKITNFLVRDPFGETTRGVVFDPGKDDVDPYLYFSAAPEDSTKTAKIKFQLHHVD